MRIGIVGSEAAKFPPETETAAKLLIQRLVGKAELVISGECHLGGIDIWAHEEADRQGVPFLPCPPAKLQWRGGYYERNLKIVSNSDLVACITVKELPEGYEGMRFKGCYHCGTDDHVKSGGCWTMKQALKRGKKGRLWII